MNDIKTATLEGVNTGRRARTRSPDQQLASMTFPDEQPAAVKTSAPAATPIPDAAPPHADQPPTAPPAPGQPQATAERPRRGRPPGSKTQREKTPRAPRKANTGEQNPQVRIRLSVETQATIDKLVRIRRNARNDLSPMGRGELVDAVFQAIEETLDQRDLACADDIVGYLSERLA